MLLLAVSCTQNNPELTSPVEPQLLENTTSFEAECHSNMYTIAIQEVIYFAVNGTFTDDLEELDLPDMACPECGESYLLQVYDEGNSYRIDCSLPRYPNHGCIVNGVPSWPMTHEEYQDICRDNMINIVMAEVIYFASHETYTENLEDLGLAGIVCPECGDIYDLQVPQCDEINVFCPQDGCRNHGNIMNGVPSWEPGGGDPQTECRANMRTIASQNVIFFASHDRYAESLEELGWGSVVCPEHGDPYIYQLLEGGTSFHLECGKPSDPNHGCIHDGVASWHEPEATEE
jgi:hypothetical protein